MPRVVPYNERRGADRQTESQKGVVDFGVLVDDRNEAVEVGGSVASPPATGAGYDQRKAKVGIKAVMCRLAICQKGMQEVLIEGSRATPPSQ